MGTAALTALADPTEPLFAVARLTAADVTGVVVVDVVVMFPSAGEADSWAAANVTDGDYRVAPVRFNVPTRVPPVP